MDATHEQAFYDGLKEIPVPCKYSQGRFGQMQHIPLEMLLPNANTSYCLLQMMQFSTHLTPWMYHSFWQARQKLGRVPLFPTYLFSTCLECMVWKPFLVRQTCTVVGKPPFNRLRVNLGIQGCNFICILVPGLNGALVNRPVTAGFSLDDFDAPGNLEDTLVTSWCGAEVWRSKALFICLRSHVTPESSRRRIFCFRCVDFWSQGDKMGRLTSFQCPLLQV